MIDVDGLPDHRDAVPDEGLPKRRNEKDGGVVYRHVARYRWRASWYHASKHKVRRSREATQCQRQRRVFFPCQYMAVQLQTADGVEVYLRRFPGIVGRPDGQLGDVLVML